VLIAAITPVAAQARRVVVRRTAPLLVTPALTAVVQGHAYRDQVLRVLAGDGDWLLAARVDGEQGWLARDRTRPAPRCIARALGAYAGGRLECGEVLAAESDTWTTWDFPDRRSPDRRWRRHGTPRLISLIERVAAGFHADHPERRLVVGDLARPHGGPFGPRYGGAGHASHQNGLDVDVILPRKDGREEPATRPAQVDLRLAREVVARFGAAPRTAIMFVGCARDYLSASPKAELLCNGLHEDHVHVRLRPGPDDARTTG
jgi:hypothetical protein